jgi:hypothetical protein
MVEEVAHLAHVDGVEGEVVEVRVSLVHERHHVVVGVDVQPDAAVTEPVGDPHAEHVRVEGHPVPERAGEAVDVAEPARASDVNRGRGS